MVILVIFVSGSLVGSDVKNRIRWWVESDDTWSALRIRGLVPDGQQLVFVSSHSMCQHCTVMAGYWSLLFCKISCSKLSRCIEDEVCCAQNTSILFTNVWIKTFQTTYTDESQQKVKILDWLLALFVCYQSRQVYWCRWWLLCSCPKHEGQTSSANPRDMGFQAQSRSNITSFAGWIRFATLQQFDWYKEYAHSCKV